MPSIFDEEDDPKRDDPPIVMADYQPASAEENIRRSGLAYSAGIVFFGSVAFMLMLGWGADWVLGSWPVGLIVGIVLGSIIGFVQFFRITAKIFPSKTDGPAVRPLMSDRKDDDGEPPI